MATTDELLSAVKDAAYWPATNAPLSDEEILRVANRLIAGELYPLLVRIDGDYYISTDRHALTAGQKRYRLPRGSFGPIRDVLYLPEGAESDDEAESWPSTTTEAAGHRTIRSRSSSARWAMRSPWYIEGDHIVLTSTPSETRDEMLVKYRRMPSTLVLAASARQIFRCPPAVAADVTAKQIAVADVTALAWTELTTWLDFINHHNAHHLLAEGFQIVDITAANTKIEFDQDIPSGVVCRSPLGLLGAPVIDADWVSVSGTTPLVPVPDEAIPFVVQAIAVEAMSIGGADEQAYARASRSLTSLRESLEDHVHDRQGAEPRYVAPRNSPIRLIGGR